MSERDKNEERHSRVETNTCYKHKTHTQREAIDYRTVLEKRRGLSIEDKVTTTDKYKEMTKNSFSPEHENDFDGVVVDFKDPWDWAPKTENSLVYIEKPCGCIDAINAGWLEVRE